MILSNPRRITQSLRGLRILVLAAAVGLMVSGCASSTPEAPEASATQTLPAVTSTPAAPLPVPVVSTIVMSGSQLMSETATEQPVSTVNFADGTEASVAFLTAALGTAPEQFLESEIEACTNVTARYSWGGTALVLDVWEPAGFVVTFGDPSFNGIALQSSGDFSVGDNAQAFFDALPAEQAFDDNADNSGPFVYDKVADASPWGEDNAYGGAALMQPGGVVSRIVSPETARAFYC